MSEDFVLARKRIDEALEVLKHDKEVVKISCSVDDGIETLRVFRVFERDGGWEIRVDIEIKDGGYEERRKYFLRYAFRTREEARLMVLETKRGNDGYEISRDNEDALE